MPRCSILCRPLIPRTSARIRAIYHLPRPNAGNARPSRGYLKLRECRFPFRCRQHVRPAAGGAGNEYRVEIGRTRDPSDCAVDRGGGYAGGDVIVSSLKEPKIGTSYRVRQCNRAWNRWCPGDRASEHRSALRLGRRKRQKRQWSGSCRRHQAVLPDLRENHFFANHHRRRRATEGYHING